MTIFPNIAISIVGIIMFKASVCSGAKLGSRTLVLKLMYFTFLKVMIFRNWIPVLKKNALK